jgi:BirA family biotin operon repressor/biotin-[acetyl-CoA-carboxylase] ligase
MLSCFEEPDLFSFTELDSTNNYAANLVRTKKIDKTFIVSADYQTEGRGQRASKWQSAKSQNALFSIYMPWSNLHLSDQFIVSMIAAVGIADVLEKVLNTKIQIKWPNDIYVVNRKIAGILIESELNGQTVSSSIIGIGVNVNQVDFGDLNNATSLKLETGQNHDRLGIVKEITKQLLETCKSLNQQTDAFHIMKKRYLSRLLGLNQYNNVIEQSTGKHLDIKPLDVTRSGLLLATDTTNKLLTFDSKEIQWVL